MNIMYRQMDRNIGQADGQTQWSERVRYTDRNTNGWTGDGYNTDRDTSDILDTLTITRVLVTVNFHTSTSHC